MRHVRTPAALVLALVACKEPPPPPPPPVVEIKVEAPKPPPIDPATLAAMEAWMKLENRKNLPLDPVLKALEKLEAAPVPSDAGFAGQYALAKWKAIAKALAVMAEIQKAAAPAADAPAADAPAEGEAPAAPPAPPPADPKFEAFVMKHAAQLVFNRAAGAQVLNTAEIWKDATTYAETTSADELSWLAADSLLAGECEGSAPCYLDRCVQTAGEYLKRQPKGAHLETALAMVRSSMPEAEDETIQTLNRGDLFKANEALETLLGLVGKVTHKDAAETINDIRTTMARFATVTPK